MIQYLECEVCHFILCKCGPTTQPKKYEGPTLADPNLTGEISEEDLWEGKK